MSKLTSRPFFAVAGALAFAAASLSGGGGGSPAQAARPAPPMCPTPTPTPAGAATPAPPMCPTRTPTPAPAGAATPPPPMCPAPTTTPAGAATPTPPMCPAPTTTPLAGTATPTPPPAGQPPPEHVTLTSEGHTLQATLLRPSGPGPFPAIVYNHGSERDPFVAKHGNIGPYFQAHGYVVLFPNRRGAGGSEGTFWEDRVDKLPAAEQDEGTVRALDVDNADVVAAVRYLQTRPYVQPAEVSVAGCSFGGIESLLTAQKSIGLRAVLDFAGGSMAWQGNRPLRERMLRAAQDARVPVLFAQAENDFDTTPSKVLAAAMQGLGKPAELHLYPPFGTSQAQGHGMFCMHGTNVWGDDVLAFLRKR